MKNVHYSKIFVKLFFLGNRETARMPLRSLTGFSASWKIKPDKFSHQKKRVPERCYSSITCSTYFDIVQCSLQQHTRHSHISSVLGAGHIASRRGDGFKQPEKNRIYVKHGKSSNTPPLKAYFPPPSLSLFCLLPRNRYVCVQHLGLVEPKIHIFSMLCTHMESCQYAVSCSLHDEGKKEQLGACMSVPFIVK